MQTPEAAVPDPSERQTVSPHWRRQLVLRAGGSLVGVVVGLVLLPDDWRKWLMAALVGAIWLPITSAFHLRRAESPRPPSLAWALTVGADIAIVATILALFPTIDLVAVLGLVLIVIVNAQFFGARWGSVVAAAAWMAVVAAAVVGPMLIVPESRVEAFEVVVAGGLLGGVAWVVGSLADDERRAAARMHLLADAIAAVGTSLELTEVLSALCRAACRALDAQFAVVLSREHGSLAVAAGVDAPVHIAAEGAEVLGRLLDDPAYADAPTPRALRTRRPVFVPDVDADGAVHAFADLIHQIGVRSMAAVPVIMSGEPVAVLNVYLARPHRFDDSEARLLDAIAEHAAIAMERSLLYSRERETVERLRELDRMKSDFVATLSHELRTPLTGIVGFAKTLRGRWKDLDADLRDELLQRVDENAGSLEHLITHLLDFSRLERGQFRVDPAPHDPADLVRRVLQNMAIELAEHRVEVEAADALPAVLTDPYAFERIVGNLLSNAAKFSPAGSAVDVSVVAEDDAVRFVVRDRGPGIPEADLPHIFDRFFRGEGASARGAGIGLTVVRDLAELQGGRVEVRNASDGTGAVFTVRLPRADRPPGTEADAVRPGEDREVPFAP